MACLERGSDLSCLLHYGCPLPVQNYAADSPAWRYRDERLSIAFNRSAQALRIRVWLSRDRITRSSRMVKSARTVWHASVCAFTGDQSEWANPRGQRKHKYSNPQFLSGSNRTGKAFTLMLAV